ncbi:hypothetical protein SAMN05216232_1975 [Virgibacillus subterraneus]|uniref:DUF1641 domain-containing protein n=1 Tax=Virgibacillus subterraneus TaxID=621109 RepID=A0A1H9EBV6_9BACI|nr:hypothetical protein [Virgibacillus subterraneus]SEQ23181.1 hypothetical protein SAMN05216232_1975 [Virgibacillus subterraneus]
MSKYDDLADKIKFDPLKTGEIKRPDFSNMVDTDQMEKEIQETLKEKEEYKQSVLNTLKNIENNTADIGSLISLVQQSNENQEEVLDVIQSIMEISTAKTIEEADSKYRHVMDKANKLNSDVKTIDGLITHGKMLWIGVKMYFENPQ